MERLDRFVAEGGKVVRRLLYSRFDHVIESLLITPEWLLELRRELECRREDIDVYITDRRTMEEISGYTIFQGVKLTARLGRKHTLESVMKDTAPPRLFVACDGLANAENMGTVIRNTAAFGGHALIVGETSTSPLLTRTIRASMGTVFELPFIHEENLVNALKDLKWQGTRIVGAHAHAKQKTIGEVDFRGDVCVVFGSEGHGLSPKVEAACDDLVIIPISPHVDSLNVGSAVAVFLYEAVRQREIPR